MFQLQKKFAKFWKCPHISENDREFERKEKLKKIKNQKWKERQKFKEMKKEKEKNW